MNLSTQMVCNSSLSYAVGPKDDIATNLLLFFNACSGFLAIVGNSMVLLAVYTTENLKTISNYFLCSLAVADLLVGFVHIPFYSSLMALHIDSKGTILKTDFLLWLQVLFATTFSLCAVSIDRYIAVKIPLRYEVIMTERRCACVITLVWICSALFALPALFMEELSTWSGYLATCAMVTLLIPLFVIISCYYDIVKISKHQQNRIGTAEAAIINTERRTNSKNRKAVTTFAIITVVFMVAFTPNFVMAVWFNYAKDCAEKSKVFCRWTISLFVMYMGSSANPVIYGMRNKDFMAAFKRMFLFVFRMPNNASFSNSSSRQ